MTRAGCGALTAALLTTFLVPISCAALAGELPPEPDPLPAAGLAPGAPVPPELRPLLENAAAHCPEITAPLLAAQIDVESGWDKDAVSDAGAQGLAQFVPHTWRSFGEDTDGNGVASPFDPADAIDAQARYMCWLITHLPSGPADPVDTALAGYHAGPVAVTAYGGPPPEARRYIREVRARLPLYEAAPLWEPASADCDFDLHRPNPRTCEEAIAAARREAASASAVWYRLCLAFVAEAYGWAASGLATATTAWRSAQASGIAVPYGTAPPAGALLFYESGGPAGHVALYLGNNEVASNDIESPGRISIAPRDHLTDGPWTLTYLGWAPPNFPHATGTSHRVG
jgi:hypothetical protein